MKRMNCERGGCRHLLSKFHAMNKHSVEKTNEHDHHVTRVAVILGLVACLFMLFIIIESTYGGLSL